MSFQLDQIGHVDRNGTTVRLIIDAPFRDALLELDGFSHVQVLWWAEYVDSDEARQTLRVRPPYAETHLTGVFATRSPVRPNPIALTTCVIRAVDQERGVVTVADIDALDGTPIVDLKAYFPVCDRVRQARIPAWLKGWPEWMPQDGIGLQDGEEDG